MIIFNSFRKNTTLKAILSCGVMLSATSSYAQYTTPKGNDVTMPLHLLKPDYVVPYGETKPADIKVVKFIDQIKDELGEAPAPPPKGAGAIQEIVKRYTSEVLFDRLSTEEAGKRAVDEMKSAIS